jgi:hypothetical protein
MMVITTTNKKPRKTKATITDEQRAAHQKELALNESLTKLRPATPINWAIAKVYRAHKIQTKKA